MNSTNEPVFTAPRRAKGPSRGPVIGSVIMLVLIAAAVGAWLQWGGSDGSEVAADETANVAADSAPVEAVPPADTTPPPPPPVLMSLSVEPAAASVTVDDSLTADPDAGITLAVGTHRVHAEAAGYLPLDTVIELAADLSLSLSLKRAPPTTGTVAVRANLPGQVVVNGRDRGAAPVSGLRLPHRSSCPSRWSRPPPRSRWTTR